MKLYLYLKRRDKKGIKIISIFTGQSNPIRIKDVAFLNLPEPWTENINKIIYEHRMEYEAWLESADSFTLFLEKLRKSGVTNLPIIEKPLVWIFNLPKTKNARSGKVPYNVKNMFIRKRNN